MTRSILTFVCLFILILSGAGFVSINAQTYSITGKLIDEHDSIVPAASLILLQQTDSSFVKGTITDNKGLFAFDGINNSDYLLVIQHLLYKKRSIPVNIDHSIDMGALTLKDNEQELGEVTVKASRPVVKMEDNVLSYSAEAISEKFVRTNALEVLCDVPGVMIKDETLQLLGANKLNIAINGKPSTMSFDQVQDMLKSMPNTNVKEIQVMYAPPAMYNVKGALINIVLNKARINEINGSVNAGFRQRRDASGIADINLQYATSKWDINFLYSGNYDKKNVKYEIDIDHTFCDTLYKIEQDMDYPGKSFDHNFQLSNTYKFDSLQTLTFSYYGNYTDDDIGPRRTDAVFSSVNDNYTEIDTSNTSSYESVHNFKLDYSLSNKLNVGIDYTYYDGPSWDYYNNKVDGEIILFKTHSNQTVNKWMAYANHSFNLWNTSFSFGVNYSYSGNKNYYDYFAYAEGIYSLDEDQSESNDYNESAASAFLSLSKQFSSRFSVDFSLKGEFDRMEKDTLDTQVELWSTFYLYPSLNVSYMPDEEMNHIFQLSLKSYTTYPGYWEISPATWYTNQYMLVEGNPELQPSQTYESELNYIYKRKYVALLSYTYTNKMITQIPYASSESFNTIARHENIDFNRELTAALVLPVSIGQHIQLKPTIAIMHQRMKAGGAQGQAFDRSSNAFILQFDNSISLIKKYGLKATVSGYYYNGIIQSIYDLGSWYDMSCGLSCNMLKNKAVLTARLDNLFRSEPDTHIDFYNQKSHYQIDRDIRMLLVSFRYNFGKAIKEKKVEVDDSRFKRMQ